MQYSLGNMLKGGGVSGKKPNVLTITILGVVTALIINIDSVDTALTIKK